MDAFAQATTRILRQSRYGFPYLSAALLFVSIFSSQDLWRRTVIRRACESPDGQKLERGRAASSMDIVSVLLFTSALIGAAAGCLRFKVFVLVPIAVSIALVSAAILHANDFATGSGIATIAACLVLNQAAYTIVQIFTPAVLLSNDVADSEPSPSREQAVHGDNGNDGN